jgi:hypothetical protein
MIQEIIQSIVVNMNSNNDQFTFLHSEKDWQNLNADEDQFPAVYLDMPVRFNSKTVAGGGIETSFICMVLFLYKSELDDNPTQRYTTIRKCMDAQREFQILLDNSPLVKSFTVGECYQILNVFDTNCDAIAMPFNLIPDSWVSVCQ